MHFWRAFVGFKTGCRQGAASAASPLRVDSPASRQVSPGWAAFGSLWSLDISRLPKVAQFHSPGLRPDEYTHLGEAVWLAQRAKIRASEVTMKTTSESLSPSETSNRRAAGGNCVVVRRGGEQPEAEPQTQTKVKPIRPVTVASLRICGEACRRLCNRPARHPSSKGRGRTVGGVWAGYVGKFSWWTAETCRCRNPREREPVGVRAAIVVKRRGNARGAKGRRKEERPRP
jgi:hypothetical protein